MPQKRTLAILLILLGLIAILGVLYWTFLPHLPKTLPFVNKTPTPTTPSQPTATTPTPTATQPTAPVVPTENQSELAARQAASAFASRQGTYSNLDGFANLSDAGLSATTEVRTYFTSRKTDLLKTHPLSAGSWGQTTKALTSKITTARPLKDTVDVSVQAQQIIDSSPPAGGSGESGVSYVEVIVTLTKQGGGWTITHVSTKPLSL